MTRRRSSPLDQAAAIERAWGRLPTGFALGWADLDSADWAALPTEERALLGPGAKAKRRREFAMGRQAARAALARSDRPAAVILKGANGEPVWPTGLIGAISHKNDLAVALVGPGEGRPGVGLDLETVAGPIHPGVAGRICHPDELPRVDSDQRVKILFSIKEAVYKAAFPTVRETVEFRKVVIDRTGSDFRARLGGLRLGRGRLARTADYLAALFFMDEV